MRVSCQLAFNLIRFAISLLELADPLDLIRIFTHVIVANNIDIVFALSFVM